MRRIRFTRRRRRWGFRSAVLVGAALMIVASGLVSGTAGAATGGTITVTPSSQVRAGQSVTVDGSGWASDAAVGWCQGVPAVGPASADDCDPTTIGTATADAEGNFSGSLILARYLDVPALGHRVDCADPAVTCTVGAADVSDIAGTAVAVTLSFVPVPLGAGSVSGGGGHLCALTSARGAKCWGYNGSGGLGDGTTTERLAPVDVSLTSGLSSIAAGGQTTCGVTDAGGVKCWGANGSGQVGDGTTTNRRTPVDVSGLTTGVTAVSVGYVHACAVTTAHGVKCWGANNDGDLGDGTTINRRTPVDVPGLTSGVLAVATGLDDPADGAHDHTCALTLAGGVLCWGANNAGQLGDGTTSDRRTPVAVSGLSSGVAAIFAGGLHTCAVMTSGGAKCWGDNDGGQLGDGTTTQRLTPVDVSGLTSGVATMALSQSSSLYGPGRSHTCALTTAGAVKCWGKNSDGEAGDGTKGNSRLTPVDVVGLDSGVVAIATSFWSGCAVRSNGAVKCWGASDTGDGTKLQRLTPVDVSGSFFRLECPTLIATAHSQFVMSDGYGVGSVATFAADPGYTLIGSDTTTCRPDGSWTDPVPIAVSTSIQTIQPGQASVNEGNTATVDLRVPVTLSAPFALTVTVDWATQVVPDAPPGQADPATDYTAASGTVTFAPGETTQHVTISVNGDTLVEPNEYIVVQFTNPTNAELGGGVGLGVITNDDRAVVVPGGASVLEGNSGTSALIVPVTLSNPSTQVVTVQWRTVFAPHGAGSQSDPATDYTAASGTVTFAPGETTQRVTISVNGDTLVEADEYLVVQFGNATNARMGGVYGLGFGFITNDD